MPVKVHTDACVGSYFACSLAAAAMLCSACCAPARAAEWAASSASAACSSCSRVSTDAPLLLEPPAPELGVYA